MTTPKKRPMRGRPASFVDSVQFSIRLERTDYDRLVDLADLLGQSLSEVIAREVRAALDRVTPEQWAAHAQMRAARAAIQGQAAPPHQPEGGTGT